MGIGVDRILVPLHNLQQRSPREPAFEIIRPDLKCVIKRDDCFVISSEIPEREAFLPQYLYRIRNICHPDRIGSVLIRESIFKSPGIALHCILIVPEKIKSPPTEIPERGRIRKAGQCQIIGFKSFIIAFQAAEDCTFHTEKQYIPKYVLCPLSGFTLPAGSFCLLIGRKGFIISPKTIEDASLHAAEFGITWHKIHGPLNDRQGVAIPPFQIQLFSF